MLQGCDFPVGAARSPLHILRLLSLTEPAADQGEIEPATARLRKQTARQLPKAISRVIESHGATARALQHARSPQRVRRDWSEFARCHSASTRTIPAEGLRAHRKIAQKNEVLHLNHADPRRGSCGQIRNRKKPRVFVPRPRRPAEGSFARHKNAKKNLEFFAPRPRRSPQGRAGTARIAKNLELFQLDHADPRRGSRGHRKNRKKPQVFAPGLRRSPQRVAVPIDDQSPAPAP